MAECYPISIQGITAAEGVDADLYVSRVCRQVCKCSNPLKKDVATGC